MKAYLSVAKGLTAGLALCASPLAQAATPLTPAQSAMSGYWHEALPPGTAYLPTPAEVFAKMKPWVAAKYAKDQAATLAGEYVPDPNTMCMPAAIPGSGSTGGLAYGFDILVGPRQVTVLYELNRGMRFAYVGETHPDRLKSSWAGHSVAHWEGDTLVVDSVGFNNENEVKLGANLKTQTSDNVRMSSKMHIVERYRLLPNGQLEDQVTFDDPGAFTAPFTMTAHYRRAAPFQEYICQENNHEGGYPTVTGRAKAMDFGATAPTPPSKPQG